MMVSFNCKMYLEPQDSYICLSNRNLFLIKTVNLTGYVATWQLSIS